MWITASPRVGVISFHLTYMTATKLGITNFLLSFLFKFYKGFAISLKQEADLWKYFISFSSAATAKKTQI